MREFQGRVVSPGKLTAKALVSRGGLNTLASFQKALQFGDKKATCGDQNNPDLYGKEMAGKALCLPRTIGSTTGGLVLYCACSMGRQPGRCWPTCGWRGTAPPCRWWTAWVRNSWTMFRMK